MKQLMEEFKYMMVSRTFSNFQVERYKKLSKYYDDKGLSVVHYAILSNNENIFESVIQNYKQINFLTKKPIILYQDFQYASQIFQQLKIDVRQCKNPMFLQSDDKIGNQLANACMICDGITCKQYKLPMYSTIIIFACATNRQRIINYILQKINQGDKEYISLLGQQNSLGINALQTCLLTRHYQEHNTNSINMNKEYLNNNFITNDTVLRKELCQITADNLTTVIIAAFCRRTCFIDFIKRLYEQVQNDPTSPTFMSYIKQMILREDDGFGCINASRNQLDGNEQNILYAYDSNIEIAVQQLYDIVSK